MFLLLQLSGAPPLPAILLGLVAVALVVLVGKVLLKVAWRLVVLAIVIVAVVWLLGLLGFQVI